MVLHLALCCVTVLLQMTCRSPKGKNIVTNYQSTLLLNGLDYHLNHLKTPIVRGLEPLLTHTSTQASLMWHLL